MCHRGKCLLVLWLLLVGCAVVGTPVAKHEPDETFDEQDTLSGAKTPRPSRDLYDGEFVTFKEAYAVAQETISIWDENGVLTGAGTTRLTTSGVVLDQNGAAASWSFGAKAATRTTEIHVNDGQYSGIGISDKGEWVCIGTTSVPLWTAAEELGCEGPTNVGMTKAVLTLDACVREAIERDPTLCQYPISAARLREMALPAEVIDSDVAVTIAREHGFADWLLVGMYLKAESWTLHFKGQVEGWQEERTIIINALTGEVVQSGEE